MEFIKKEHKKKLVKNIYNELIFIGDADDYVERSLAHFRIISDVLFLKRDPETFFRIRKGWDKPEDEKKLARVLSDIIDIDDKKVRADAAAEFMFLLIAIGYIIDD